MTHKFRLLLLSITFFCGYSQINATHNRAGEITYRQTGELTIEATITTYTKASSADADRDTLLMMWGDGSSTQVLRSNGTGELLENDIKLNYYIAEHTYPGQGTYTMSVQDPNRVGSILNVNWPNSVNVPFYIETTFTFLNPQFQGFNNSAQLLQAPIDFACVGERFIHNPNAFDADGDSLAFEFFVPFQDRNFPVPNYQLPDEIGPSPDNNISIDEITGNVVWDAPQLQGEYNITLKIKEYRDGLLINSITRDMQILVTACDNAPPLISVQESVCVIAGEELILPINVTDTDAGQLVQLSATGGPFTLEDSPATLQTSSLYQTVPINAVFRWQTTCNHSSDQEYQVVFRAVDNAFGNTGLADLKTINIKVVAPEPESLTGETINNAVRISWQKPYQCEITDDDYFRGFSVWKKINSHSLPDDNCANGLENDPYEKIVFLTNEMENGRYIAIDNDVEPGTTYCYRVLAEFAKLTNSGNPFNKVASLPSEELCVLLDRDLPMLTHVDVLSTDGNNGSIEIKWIKPVAADLDTILNPGPYRYQLTRGEGLNPNFFEEIPSASFTSMFFDQSIDLGFIDNNLNTRDNAYSYKIDFYAADLNLPYGESKMASSVYLTASPSDKSAILNWEFNVPWSNIEYTVYRLNDNTGQFDSIAITTNPSFVDINLENSETYCYQIRASGTYGLTDIPSPLINFSEEQCATPFDNQAPCIPSMDISSVCDNEQFNSTENIFENELTWTMPDRDCPGSTDLSGYNVYFTPVKDDSFSLISTINDPEQNEFIHQREGSISGCYAITALDSLGNESMLSDSICITNCPFYELPNVFTPNDDDIHELFRPITVRFIDKIDMEIYNRWGQKVFVTSDPMINWNGHNLQDKKLPDGAYYYTCRVFLQDINGNSIQNDLLSGYIHIIGSK